MGLGFRVAVYKDIPTLLLRFITSGIRWDIPILWFAHVLFWDPTGDYIIHQLDMGILLCKQIDTQKAHCNDQCPSVR